MGLTKLLSLIVVLFTIGATIFFAQSLRSLCVENKPGRFELQYDDPTRLELRKFQRKFRTRESLVLGVEFTNHTVSNDDLEQMVRLSNRLREISGVTATHSVVTVRILRQKQLLGVPFFEMQRLYRQTETKPPGLAQILQNNPSYCSILTGNLVSEDTSNLAIVLDIASDTSESNDGLAFHTNLLSDIRSTLKEFEGPGVTFHLAGTPLLAVAFQDALVHDLRLVAPFSVAGFIFITALLFRAWRPAVAVFLVALAALVWSLGWLSVTDTAMSVGLAVIVPLILAISITHGIHYLAFLSRRARDGPVQQKDIKDMLRIVGYPALLSAVTTIIGFLALASSDLVGIREVGLNVAVGIVSVWFLNGVFLPALMFIYPSLRITGSRSLLCHNVGDLIYRTLQSRKTLLLWLAAVTTVICVCGITQLRTETNNLEYFPEGSKLREGFSFADRQFGGVLPLEVTITEVLGNEVAAIGVIESIQNKLRTIKGIGNTMSVVDLMKTTAFWTTKDYASLSVRLKQADSARVRRVWPLLESLRGGSNLLVSDDTTRTFRIACRARLSQSEDLRRLLDSVRTFVYQHANHREATVTGMVPFFVRVNDYVLGTQNRSFAIALIVTALLLAMVSRKPVLVVCVVAVNIFPIVVVLGLMGWSSIPLDISTVMIASIAIGIVVDDTIHFIMRFRSGLANQYSVQESIHHSLHTVGTPILSTTVVLVAGFGVLAVSQFIPTRAFGVLSALTVAVAGIADLFLLPALLLTVSRKRSTSKQERSD